MLVLVTDRCEAEHSGNRVVVTIPSGKDSFQASLSLEDAMFLARRVQLAATMGFAEIEQQSTAEIIAFPKRGRRRHG